LFNFVRILDRTGVRDMQMVAPDYWKGKGRYSKQAISRKVEDDSPFSPPGAQAAEGQDEN
jgi:hypothetical protein